MDVKTETDQFTDLHNYPTGEANQAGSVDYAFRYSTFLRGLSKCDLQTAAENGLKVSEVQIFGPHFRHHRIKRSEGTAGCVLFEVTLQMIPMHVKYGGPAECCTTSQPKCTPESKGRAVRSLFMPKAK